MSIHFQPSFASQWTTYHPGIWLYPVKRVFSQALRLDTREKQDKARVNGALQVLNSREEKCLNFTGPFTTSEPPMPEMVRFHGYFVGHVEVESRCPFKRSECGKLRLNHVSSVCMPPHLMFSRSSRVSIERVLHLYELYRLNELNQFVPIWFWVCFTRTHQILLPIDVQNQKQLSNGRRNDHLRRNRVHAL